MLEIWTINVKDMLAFVWFVPLLLANTGTGISIHGLTSMHSLYVYHRKEYSSLSLHDQHSWFLMVKNICQRHYYVGASFISGQDMNSNKMEFPEVIDLTVVLPDRRVKTVSVDSRWESNPLPFLPRSHSCHTQILLNLLHAFLVM